MQKKEKERAILSWRLRHASSVHRCTRTMSAQPLIEVIKGLYIGNEIQAATRLLLIEHGVHFIVNAAGSQVANHFADFGFEYLPLDLYDTTEDDITQFFDASFEFIGMSNCTEA